MQQNEIIEQLNNMPSDDIVYINTNSFDRIGVCTVWKGVDGKIHIDNVPKEEPMTVEEFVDELGEPVLVEVYYNGKRITSVDTGIIGSVNLNID